MSPCLLRQVKKDRLGPCGTSSKGRGGRTSSPRFGRVLISSHRRYRVLGQQVSLLDVSRFHSPPSPGPGWARGPSLQLGVGAAAGGRFQVQCVSRAKSMASVPQWSHKGSSWFRQQKANPSPLRYVGAWGSTPLQL